MTTTYLYVANEYRGHGSDFVTEAAYRAWREARIAESNAAIAAALAAGAR